MKNYCTYELDKEFLKIDGIKYLPWIGKNGLKTKERILIVGESVYNWEKDLEKRKIAQSRLEKNDFARVVAFEHGIENPHPKRKFARNIEKTLSSNFKIEKERVNFWKSIIFHELVQRPLENNKTRPTKTDYQNGAKVLTSLIQITKPTRCIFLGTTWSKYILLKNSLDELYKTDCIHFEKINNARPKILQIKELNTKIYFIKHPSKFFSPELWKEFIMSN